jgi:multidrug resistance protein, MATE family
MASQRPESHHGTGAHGSQHASEGDIEEPRIGAEPPRQGRRSGIDLLSGRLRPTVFRLALPVFGEQFLHFLVGFYDVFLAGNLGEDIRTEATAAVGVAAYVGWLASMVFSTVGIGTTALVARAWGAGDRPRAQDVTNRSIVLGVLFGAGFLLFILPGAPLLVNLFGLTGSSAEIAVRYLRLDALGLLFFCFSLIIAAALRGSGDMQTPMWIFSFVNLLNIAVSTVLVYGVGPIPAWGVDGIVTGTVVARVSGGLLTLACLIRGTNGLSLVWRQMRLRGEPTRHILRIGVPAAAEGLVMWIGHAIFLRVISDLGSASFAAHIIGIRVEAITYLPAVAWGHAAATMVGQSLGAGNRERAIQAGHEATFQCALFGILITLWFTLGAGGIYALMHQDPFVREIGVPAFRVVGLFQIPLILGIVYFAALRGAGETRMPLAITAFTTYLIRIPIGYVLGVTFEMGLMGAWMGMNLDMLIRGLLASWLFSSRRWLETRR